MEITSPSRQTIRPTTSTGFYRRVVPKRLRNLVRHALSLYRNRGFKPYWVTIDTCSRPVRIFIANREGEAWHTPYVTRENREMTFARDTMVREGSRMVEVGTHHGFTAVLLATFGGPSSSLTCFEPLDENVAIARANFDANELKNIRLVHAAVGDTNGTTYIAMAGSNPAVQAHPGFAKPCRLVRLDDEIPGEIDFLKIDVEGFELHVLRGAQRLLRNRPHLQIEVHPGPISEFGGTVEQLFELIPTESYDFWIQPDTITEPVHYTVGTPIQANSHLFGVRKPD